MTKEDLIQDCYVKIFDSDKYDVNSKEHIPITRICRNLMLDKLEKLELRKEITRTSEYSDEKNNASIDYTESSFKESMEEILKRDVDLSYDEINTFFYCVNGYKKKDGCIDHLYENEVKRVSKNKLTNEQTRIISKLVMFILDNI